MRRTISILLVVMMVPAVALAQSTTTVAVNDSFIAAIRDGAVVVVSGIASAFLGWVAYWIKQKFGIDIEARHREAIRLFITRQASGLIAAGAVKLQGIKVDVSNQALATAANVAMTAIPDAMNYFGLTPQVIAKMIVDVIPKEPAVAAAQAVALDVKNPETPSSGKSL